MKWNYSKKFHIIHIHIFRNKKKYTFIGKIKNRKIKLMTIIIQILMENFFSQISQIKFKKKAASVINMQINIKKSVFPK